MVKRCFDFLFSLAGIIILLPLFIILALWVSFDSSGGFIYAQVRVGRYGKDFRLLKFRTMSSGADKLGLLTVGKDQRITRAGRILRKYKLDELPQLFNVLKGDMSLVGPRPEVRKYVILYSSVQKEVLLMKPGITDYASIEFSGENEILASADDPEKMYINEIMPAKIKLNLKYREEQGLFTDMKIIILTLAKIFG